MKILTILGIFALFLLLVIPGAVSAADVTVSGSIVKPDLVVTAIAANGANNELFANAPNTIAVTVQNSGTADAGAFDVSVDVAGTVYTINIAGLAQGASTSQAISDPTLHSAGTSVTITATADSTAAINEGDETNNALTVTKEVKKNGYMGKRWTDSTDMTTQATFNGRYDVKYSPGNSAYKSAKWTSATVTWTSSDLPIPTGATVVSARLYQPYSYNKMTSDPAFTASFNSNTVSTIATYKDIKGFGTYSYPYGLYVYDVTSQFNTAGNTLALTPEGTPGTTNDYALWGAYLVVTYSDSAATEKQIWINDEFDMVQANSGYCVYNDKSIVFAKFSGVDTTDMGSATVIAILASAADSGKSKFYFGGQEYTGFWADYLSGPQIGFSVYDVESAIGSGVNEARLQSYDPGTNGDNMYAMNTILIVEKTEAAVTADFSAIPTSGDKPLTVAFTDLSTGYITGYAWDFGDSGTSTEANPSHEYTARGSYTVSLTVTGVGSSDTETKTDYITVKEPAPVVDFSADKTNVVFGEPITFTGTNTGGVVNNWAWDFGDGTGSGQIASHTYNSAGTYTVTLTATGPDYNDVETKTNYITVGAASIDVSVTDAAIDFGTMAAGVDETGSTTVNVDVTYGTAWSVTAAANNGGYMKAGALQLESPFQLSNGGEFSPMTSNFANFLTGAAGVEGSGPANVKQAIAAADAPGAYSITLTFTGTMA